MQLLITLFRISTLIFSNVASKCMNTRLRLWRFITSAALVTILLFLHYVVPTASYFYTQDISLHSHVLKCLLHALSGCKYKNFTPLRHYDVTGLIYTKTFSTIVISAPKNPGLPVDFSSISYILQISYQTVASKYIITLCRLFTFIAMPAYNLINFFLKLQYNIDQELITIIRLTTIGNVQLAVKIN